MPRHDLDPAERADIASRIARIVSDEAAHASGGDPSSARKIRRGVVRALQDMERHEADPKPTSGRRSRTRTEPGPVTLTEGKRIVFFLGAGASVPLGYPVSNGILPAIWSGLARDDEDGWRSWAGFQARGNRQADTRARAELQRFLLDLLPGLKDAGQGFQGASILDVISMLDHSVTERVTPFSPERVAAGQQRKLNQPALELLRARDLVNRAINGVLQGRRGRDLRRRFATWIVRNAVREGRHDPSSNRRRVTIISTNYDTAFELPLVAALGKRRRGAAAEIDFGFTWRDRESGLHVHRPDAPIGIFKLHGSLNWLRCETCGHVYINTDKRISSLDSWQVKNEYNSCVCGGLLKSLLVTPSVARNIRDANLLSLWNSALEDLRRADEWIMIGYSLPSEDVAIRSLLLRAYHARACVAQGKPQDLRVRVVQFESPEPAAPPSPRDPFRLLFPADVFDEADYDARGVEAWMKDHLLPRAAT